jgi:site-specific DNA-methyltransferase (adenine-specific)
MTREDFLEDTIDVWEIPAESATRVGHPAPFPVELAARLIELYSYRGDLILDPFVGSGTTAVAALRTDRHYVGYDLDQSYIRAAEVRLDEERQRRLSSESQLPMPIEGPDDDDWSDQAGEARSAKDMARMLIESAGFRDLTTDSRRACGLSVSFAALDPSGHVWLFDVAGALTTYRPGLGRADALWRAVAKASVLHQTDGTPFVVLAPGLPAPTSAAGRSLRAVTGEGAPVRAVVDMTSPSARRDLSDLTH